MNQLNRFYALAVPGVVSMALFSCHSDLEWSHAFFTDQHDYGNAVIGATDGGYIVAGSIMCCDDEDSGALIIKVDPLGGQAWSLVSGDSSDNGHDVSQTADGGIVLVGSSDIDPTDNVHDVLLMKATESGDIAWLHRFSGEQTVKATSVVCLSDRSCIVGGTIYNDFSECILLKFTEDGTEEWRRTYTTGNHTSCRSVQSTRDGGFVLVGLSADYSPEESDNIDVVVIKTNSEGDEEWANSYGTGADEYGYAVVEADDGCFLIAGTWSEQSEGSEPSRHLHILLLSIGPDGRELWMRGHENRLDAIAYSIARTHDGEYVLAGQVDYSNDAPDAFGAFIMKVDEGGHEQWIRQFTAFEQMWARDVINTRDGGYLLAGSSWTDGTYFDVWAMKTDEEGYGPEDVTRLEIK